MMSKKKSKINRVQQKRAFFISDYAKRLANFIGTNSAGDGNQYNVRTPFQFLQFTIVPSQGNKETKTCTTAGIDVL